jgi:hypothetical protein
MWGVTSPRPAGYRQPTLRRHEARVESALIEALPRVSRRLARPLWTPSKDAVMSSQINNARPAMLYHRSQ